MSNQVSLIGTISTPFTYDHEMCGEKYYKFFLSVKRASGAVDNIPMLLSERLINLRDYPINTYVQIKGQFRSYNLHEANKVKLILYVFVTEIEKVEPDDYNDIFLEGVIVKHPSYRSTPLGRNIADIMLSVPRFYNKCDYIPCVCWGRTAKYVSNLDIGSVIRVAGRIQSREYNKSGEIKTAYEVSVNLVESV